MAKRRSHFRIAITSFKLFFSKATTLLISVGSVKISGRIGGISAIAGTTILLAFLASHAGLTWNIVFTVSGQAQSP